VNPYENHSQTGPKVVISRGTSQEWLVISGVIDYFNAESVAALILAELQGAGNTADQAVAAVTENRWLHLDKSREECRTGPATRPARTAASDTKSGPDRRARRFPRSHDWRAGIGP